MSSEDRPQRPIRPVPTRHPMALPTAALVAVTDTNALAARACHAAQRGLAEDLFIGLAATGRSNPYVSAHVPGELEEHLGDVAAKRTGLTLAEAEAILWGQVMPQVPVVDLAVGDYLHPRVLPLMREDPQLPRGVRGDVDDIGTAALAEFLAPAVIISADSVFNRFGLANTVANTWLPTAYELLKAAGFEANLTDAAMLLEIAGRILIGAGSLAVHLAGEHPLPAGIVGTVLSVAAFIAYRAGYLNGDLIATQLRWLGQATRSLSQQISQAFAGYENARGALKVIEPYGPPTIEQLTARYLARRGTPMTLTGLEHALTASGYRLDDGELSQAVTTHPAFTETDGAYGIGRTALGAPVRRIANRPEAV